MDPELRREQRRAYYAANADALNSYARAWRRANLDTSRTKERGRARHRRSRDPERHRAENRRAFAKLWAENPEIIRQRARQYLQRSDRPCKHAADGCTEYALPWEKSCRTHRNGDRTARRQRKQQVLAVELAQAQAWICTWCGDPLPADLADTVVDHVIPRSAGGPDERWNYELLHIPCNGPGGKWHKITPRALELAAQRGLRLTSVAA
jgi:5-methylcytosine-specific restriction endonuclease McrA